MGKARSPLRAVSQHKRFVFTAVAISTLGLFVLSPLSFTPTAWHITLRLLPQTPPDVHSFPLTPDLPTHEYVEGGRLKTTIGGRHPLHGLIKDAEMTWDKMVKSQSTTFSAAVKEYQHRYGRRPPKGFDKWYEFARSVNFKLIDEFDQIDRDITPFLALPHHVMQHRLELASKDDHSYHFTVKDGNFSIVGKQFLEGDLKFYVSGHDGGPTILPEDMRLAVSRVLKAGKRLTEEEIIRLDDLERNPRRGVANACLQDPISSYPSALPEQNLHTHTFISDHRRSMSFCANPTMLNNPAKRHGYFAYDVPHQRIASPLFVQSQPEAGGALLHPALQSYILFLFWRGRTTGEFFNKAHDWRFSHRIRIHTLTTPGGNLTDPNVTSQVEVLVEDGPDGGVRPQAYSRDVLNEKYMDVSLIGGAVQCDNSDTDRTCQNMDESLIWGKETGWEAGLSNKFLLDIDGNGWSSRFQRLLTSGALIPYYHYVPIQVDYSDLYDTLAFFSGTPDGLPGYDHLAEKIGAQGHTFTAEQWRPEDMQVYIYRLLLEYARVVEEDTDTMSMA
ncbi:unnamed protein product [Rhizoctonia solani]|uniref:Glycosyl transferase CAP10 domain-containing protein n=1 Tax=Rhizoctonia solani TaxID=456999 RepID=A0A8H3A8F3_9AGAM|nr:unnamed protein product [Rhizoctonia solani]